MSFENAELPKTPFTLDDKRYILAESTELHDMYITLKNECKALLEQDYISFMQMAKIGLAIDLIEIKTSSSTWEYKKSILEAKVK